MTRVHGLPVKPGNGDISINKPQNIHFLKEKQNKQDLRKKRRRE